MYWLKTINQFILINYWNNILFCRLIWIIFTMNKTPFITFRIEMYIINMDCFKMTKCIKSLYLYFRYSFIVIDYWKGNVSESDINKNA